MHRTPKIAVAVAAVSLLATSLAPPANAVEPDPIFEGLVSPLSLAVADDGTIYVAQNFAGLLTKVSVGADPEVIHAEDGLELGAVSVEGEKVTFATTSMGGPASARVYTLEDGDRSMIANLWAYEKAKNPDRKVSYGIQKLSRSCVKKIPKRKRMGIVAYQGIKESHPYATAIDGTTTYVADAAANAVFGITGKGVRTTAVLPPVKVTVSKKLQKQTKLPKCVVGKTFKGEPVPTDVELGPDGNLYVTTLGGGLGEQLPLGGVYRIDPDTKKVTKMAGGLFSPVGLAIAPDGTSFISLLFPGQVLQVPLGGSPTPLAEVPFPGDIEYADGDVYVTETDLTNDGSSPPAGKVLRIGLK